MLSFEHLAFCPVLPHMLSFEHLAFCSGLLRKTCVESHVSFLGLLDNYPFWPALSHPCSSHSRPFDRLAFLLVNRGILKRAGAIK